MTANGNPQETIDILFKTRVEANQAEVQLKKLESKIKKIQSSLEDKPTSIILGVDDTSLIEAETAIVEATMRARLVNGVFNQTNAYLTTKMLG